MRPKCSHRAGAPTCSATAVVKAITSCLVISSIASMRAMSISIDAAFARSSAAASRGIRPASAVASAAASSTSSQVS